MVMERQTVNLQKLVQHVAVPGTFIPVKVSLQLKHPAPIVKDWVKR